MSTQKNNLFLKISKIIFGIALVAYLLTRIDLYKLLETYRNCSYFEVFLSMSVFGFAVILQASRLHILIGQYGFQLYEAIRIFLISMFFNNLTATIIGDGYKILAIRKKCHNLRRPIAIIFIERFVGSLVVILYGLFYLILYKNRFIAVIRFKEIQPRYNLSLVLSFFAITGIIVIILLIKKKRLYWRFIGLLKDIKRVFHELYLIKFFLIIILTVGAHLFVAAKIYFLTKAFGESIRLIDTIFIIFLLFVAAYIPISVGSLGIREGITFIALLVFGVAQPAAAAVALSARIIIYLYAIAGGILFIPIKRTNETNGLSKSIIP